MDVPLACTLDHSGARARVDGWRRVLAGAVVTAERVSPRELRLHLRDDAPPVGALVDLARREAACCPFFEFSLLVAAGGLVLRVGVPDGDAAVLDAFAAACRPA